MSYKLVACKLYYHRDLAILCHKEQRLLKSGPKLVQRTYHNVADYVYIGGGGGGQATIIILMRQEKVTSKVEERKRIHNEVNTLSR